MRDRLSNEICENGYAIIDNFLTSEEVDELHKAGCELCTQVPKCNGKIFSTLNFSDSRSKQMYFMESSDKVHYFFEENAINANGDLIVDREAALNKIGHALHMEHPKFHEITFSNRVKEICWQLKYSRPAVCQSMYIYKNPSIGGEVIPHQDSWFLHTEPNAVLGFWIALEDCNEENGCLQFIRGSHKSGVHRRYLRNTDKNVKHLMHYDKGPPIYERSKFVPIPVNKGTCILIHGNVVHKSDANYSKNSRNAYIFHIIETDHNVVYSEENWLQLPKGKSFPILYNKKH